MKSLRVRIGAEIRSGRRKQSITQTKILSYDPPPRVSFFLTNKDAFFYLLVLTVSYPRQLSWDDL